MEESAGGGQPVLRVPQFGPRRRGVRRGFITVPGLARRGRTTLRHFVQLLLGGFVSVVEERRRRGERGILFRFQSLLSRLCRLFVDTDLAMQPFAVQLRQRLEVLGPTYVKLGQILSLRMDLLPERVTNELRNLLSHLPPVPFEEIASIVEADLGRPIVEVFEEVDPEPLGSASIAQSHRALSRDGRRVLLKVVKPGIRELLHRDTALLRMFGRILQVLFPRYQPRRMIEEFCDYTLREIDMLLEAENAETFSNNFVDLPDVVFPKVYRELSGPRVLCMEFLDGVQPTVEVAQRLPEEDRQKLIDLGAAAVIRMLYEDGFFHADLHPGNLLILPGARVGFIDLGMVGRLDPSLRADLLALFFSLVIEDFDGAARHLSAVAQAEPESDVIGFRRAVRELCRRWRRSATFEEFSLALLILEAVQLGARYQLYFPVEMVLMVKALVTYEGVGYLLDPGFNVAEVSQRHVNRIFRSQFSPLRLLREGLRGTPELIDAVGKVPMLMNETLRVLEQQSRRQPEGPFQGVRATLFGGFCVLSGAVVVATGGPWPLWVGLLLLGLVVSLRRRR